MPVKTGIQAWIPAFPRPRFCGASPSAGRGAGMTHCAIYLPK